MSPSGPLTSLSLSCSLVTRSQAHRPPEGMDKDRVSVNSWYEWSPVMIIPNPRGSDLVTQMVKNLLAMQETQVQPLGREDPLEKGMATHSNILAWRSLWTEEPDGLQSMGPKESDTIEQLSLSTSTSRRWHLQPHPPTLKGS